MRALVPALAIAALAAAALLAGCSKKATAPAVRGAPTRDVTVLVTDSLGAPAANMPVGCLSEGIETDPDLLAIRDSNAQGAVTFTAYASTSTFWTDGVYAPVGEPPTPVAASVSAIRAPTDADTVLVRLVLHTSSDAGGTIRLAGAAFHHGTQIVALGYPTAAVTDSSGRWSLAGLPPGHWIFYGLHPGYGSAPITIDVPVPGSHVTASTVTLPASP